MKITCPACKKKNSAETECQRCGCELEILISISKAAEEKLVLGRVSLKQGDSLEALKNATESWHLKNSPAAAKLAFFANITTLNFAEALKWYSAIKNLTKKHE